MIFLNGEFTFFSKMEQRQDLTEEEDNKFQSKGWNDAQRQCIYSTIQSFMFGVRRKVYMYQDQKLKLYICDHEDSIPSPQDWWMGLTR